MRPIRNEDKRRIVNDWVKMGGQLKGVDLTKKIGEFYGYPSCCIEHFVAQGEKFQGPWTGTGFLPCAKHAAYLLKSRAPIDSIFRGRKASTKFPESDNYLLILYVNGSFKVNDQLLVK